MTRDITIRDVSLSQIGIADFSILIANAAAYFMLGLIIFIFCERIAMRKGLLAHY